jgi:sensor histidine kinase regulating citrate/malate metabolism
MGSYHFYATEKTWNFIDIYVIKYFFFFRLDFKTALIVVCCVAGALFLLILMVCWYQYCNRNRKKSMEMTSTTVANTGADNTGYDTMNMDRL